MIFYLELDHISLSLDVPYSIFSPRSRIKSGTKYVCSRLGEWASHPMLLGHKHHFDVFLLSCMGHPGETYIFLRLCMTRLVLPQHLFSYSEALHSYTPIVVVLSARFVGRIAELSCFMFLIKYV